MQCQECGTKENLFVNSTRQKSDGTLSVNYLCRRCNTERKRRYRNTENGMAKTRKAVYKSIAKHRDRQIARQKLITQIRLGNIARPCTCQECKRKARIEAHHEDYSKPLDVKWLCKSCHCLEHKKVL